MQRSTAISLFIAACLASLLTVSSFPAAAARRVAFSAAFSLPSLVAKYQTLEAKAGPLRNKKNKLQKLIKKEIEPVLDSIAGVGSNRSLAFLGEQLQHSIPALAKAAAKSMRKIDDVRAAQLLVGSVRPEPSLGKRTKKPDATRDYNDEVIDSLVTMKNADAGRWLADRAFSKASTEQLRVLCTVAERKNIKAGERLVRLIRHRNSAVASAALSALAAVGVDPYVAALAKLDIDNLDRDARIAILDALARCTQPTAIDIVLAAASSRDSETRTIVMGSLGLKAKSETALKGVIVGLKDGSPPVATAALRAIRNFRFKAVIPALIEGLGSLPNERLRIDALDLLTHLTDQNMGMSTEDWSRWWEMAEPRFVFAEKARGGTSAKRRGLRYFGVEVRSKRSIFLVDYSLSMDKAPGGDTPTADNPSKMSTVKRELTRLLQELPTDARINLVLFHAKPVSWKKKLTAMSAAHRESAIEFVANGKTEFGTNIFDTLELALADAEVDTIYLLTDGLPVGGEIQDPGEIRRVIKNVNRVRQVTIHTLGFGDGAGFLKKLAKENGGECKILGKKKAKKK